MCTYPVIPTFLVLFVIVIVSRRFCEDGITRRREETTAWCPRKFDERCGYWEIGDRRAEYVLDLRC